MHTAGVVAKLAHMCVQHGVKEKTFFKQLLKAFHVAAGKDGHVLRLVLAMTTEDRFESLTSQDQPANPDALYTFGGCMIVQELFNFPADVVQSLVEGFLAIPSVFLVCCFRCGVRSALTVRAVAGDELYAMGKHSVGSRIIEAFLQSSVAAPLKTKFIRNMMVSDSLLFLAGHC